MKAAALAFRFRLSSSCCSIYLDFCHPGSSLRGGSQGTLWLAASTLAARSGWIGLAAATVTVTLIALACLVLGAMLRVWGTAYLGSGVMRGSAMQGDRWSPRDLIVIFAIHSISAPGCSRLAPLF